MAVEAVARARSPGRSPLTPIQHWFFARSWPTPDHFNQALLLGPGAAGPGGPGSVRCAACWCAPRRAAPALPPRRTAAGGRPATPPERGAAGRCSGSTSRPADDERRPAASSAPLAGELQAGFDLAAGPLVARCPGSTAAAPAPAACCWPSTTWWSTASPGASCSRTWRPPTARPAAGDEVPPAGQDDLVPALGRAPRGARPASGDLARRRSTTGSTPPARRGAPLPGRPPAGGDTVGSGRSVTAVARRGDRPTRCCARCPAAYRTPVDELLLAALGRALGPLGGGRDRCWSTSRATAASRSRRRPRPLAHRRLVHHPLPGARRLGRARRSARSALTAVKEALRDGPRRGLGYGLLRYLRRDRRRRRAARRCRGRRSASTTSASSTRRCRRARRSAPRRSRRARRADRDQRRRTCSRSTPAWSTARLQLGLDLQHAAAPAETIREAWRTPSSTQLAAAGRALPRRPSAGGVRRRPTSRLGRACDQGGAANRSRRHRPAVEDIYPLSPLQEGLLFHSLAAPEAGVYFEQLTCRAAGRPRPEAFAAAWQRRDRRHPVAAHRLRLARASTQPLQVVDRGRSSCRSSGSTGATGRRGGEPPRPGRATWHADRRRGFDLARPPLMRLALIRAAADAAALRLEPPPPAPRRLVACRCCCARCSPLYDA